MTRDLYMQIWMMINGNLERAKKVEQDWLDSMLVTPENDYTYADCIKYVKQAHADIQKYTAMLEQFESEVKEPKF